ncbi:Sec-independent protein translocase protein TatB [Mesorhizobium koreense]|uniref:Sec-independent protein translocase protein TatB n=1 Tax=Mesorhizobium koreense TaxID=3074855 RepID=UPI00287BB3EC|nr:Sec-independent protein translocase protein TatB [Mesorhizobium sp. WR6]
MFDVGWSEMLVIAIVLIVVVGPKDLPRMLRQFGRTTSKLRTMAGDFRRQFDEALKEAELDDVTETLSSVRKINPMNEIRKHLAPIEDVGQQVRAGLDDALKPQPKPTPAETAAEPVAAEPLKNGAAALPGEAAPKPKKTPARAKAAVAKTGARKTAAPKISASAGVAAPVKAAPPKASGKTSPKAGAAPKTPASKTTAAKASKSASASAKRAPARTGPAGRKKTGSAR